MPWFMTRPMRRAMLGSSRRIWPFGAALLAIGLVSAPYAEASDRSTVLVAKGELAYHQGRLDDSVSLLRQAVAADSQDPVAHLALGQVLLETGNRTDAIASFERSLEIRPGFPAAERALATARSGRSTSGLFGTVSDVARPEAGPGRATAKRWGVTLTTGLQYDDNVTIEPSGRVPVSLGDTDDIAFIFGFTGHFDVVSREDVLLRLEYDLYQSLHPDIDDFDFRSNRVWGTASYALAPWVWIGLQGGYNHYTLGPHSYLGESFVLPFLSVLQETWGLTQLTYRHGENTFWGFSDFGSPFRDVRDGPTDAASIDQTLYLQEKYFTFGYRFERENPDRSGGRTTVPVGNDFELDSNQLTLGGGSSLLWEVYLDLLYLYRMDDYDNPQSVSGFTKHRNDDGHFFYAALSRPITDHVSVVVNYYGTINDSDLSVFEYNRNVIGTLLQVSF